MENKISEQPPSYADAINFQPPSAPIMDGSNIPKAHSHQEQQTEESFVRTSYGSIVDPVDPHVQVFVSSRRICSSCFRGDVEDYYPCLSIFCAIAFFPIGILCCLAMKSKRCNNCDLEY